MVIRIRQHQKLRGVLMAEMTIAMSILVIAFLPIAYAAGSTARRLRATYERAVATEIVDGEMEILAAGEWRTLPEGAQTWTVHARSATNLPPGKFLFTRAGNHIRLEWSATEKHGIGQVVREATLP
jgi:Tfp pilus assembly protein PilV